jgi:hypothetical protein
MFDGGFGMPQCITMENAAPRIVRGQADHSIVTVSEGVMG